MLLRSDFEDVGAEEPFSEGIIDHLRAVEGADMVALIREPPTVRRPDAARQPAHDGRGASTSPRSLGEAAGVGTDRRPASRASSPIEEIVGFIRREYLAQGAGDG